MFDTIERLSSCCFAEVVLENSHEMGIIGDVCMKCGNSCDWIPKVKVDLSTTKRNLSYLETFTECKHKSNNEIAPDCIHCNMAWTIERIKILEMQPKKVYLVHNDTTSVYFSTREKAETFASGYGAATGLSIVEVDIF